MWRSIGLIQAGLSKPLSSYACRLQPKNGGAGWAQVVLLRPINFPLPWGGELTAKPGCETSYTPTLITTLYSEYVICRSCIQPVPCCIISSQLLPRSLLLPSHSILPCFKHFASLFSTSCCCVCSCLIVLSLEEAGFNFLLLANYLIYINISSLTSTLGFSRRMGEG